MIKKFFGPAGQEESVKKVLRKFGGMVEYCEVLVYQGNRDNDSVKSTIVELNLDKISLGYISDALEDLGFSME